MTKDELEGRIRAIEAVLIELREVTPDVIDAAKAYLRDPNRDPKRWPDPKMAEVRLQIAGNLDEHAEKALNDLKRAVGARSGVGKKKPEPTDRKRRDQP